MTNVSAAARRWRGLLLIAAMAGVAVVSATIGANAAVDRFGDVPAGHPHADGIGWLADAQVTTGCGDGSGFCPGEGVSRAQLASFMHRLSGHAAGVAPSVDAATLQGLTPADLRGEPGPRGAQGPEGPQGPAGADANTAALEARLDALEGRIDDLEADNAALAATVADQQTELSELEEVVSDQQAEIGALETLLDGVSRQDDAQGRDTLVVAGMNLQVVNGTGTTGGAPNGLGNLIVGYDTEPETDPDKSGSHYLVVGDEHTYTAFGGILAGFRNTASGSWASVSGGARNTASAGWTSVSGGRDNSASASFASVSGGEGNTASATFSSVSGGLQNIADGGWASTSGGRHNIANGTFASVSGGEGNTAGGIRTSILGGLNRVVGSDDSCYPAC